MAAKKKGDDKNKYYSHLIINRNLKWGFFGFIAFFFSLFTFIIGRNAFNNAGWIGILAPILLFSIPIILYPMIEDWEYQPWQVMAQKYERHLRE